MTNIKEYLEETATKININLAILDEDSVTLLRKKTKSILNPYDLNPMCLVHDRDAWKWIKDYIGINEAILFFREEKCIEMFALENGGYLESLIEQIYAAWDPFFITNRNASYLLEVNEYDDLKAYGEAIQWLEKYVEIHGKKLKCYNK